MSCRTGPLRAWGGHFVPLYLVGVKRGSGCSRCSQDELDELAFTETEGAVAACGEGQVVGDEDAGEGVGLVERLQEGEDRFGGALVEVACGFVGEEDLGLGDEGAGEGDALLLATGELAGTVLGSVG